MSKTTDRVFPITADWCGSGMTKQKRETADYMESWLKRGEGERVHGWHGRFWKPYTTKEHQINYIKFEMWWNAMSVMWPLQQVYYRTEANISQYPCIPQSLWSHVIRVYMLVQSFVLHGLILEVTPTVEFIGRQFWGIWEKASKRRTEKIAWRDASYIWLSIKVRYMNWFNGIVNNSGGRVPYTGSRREVQTGFW